MSLTLKLLYKQSIDPFLRDKCKRDINACEDPAVLYAAYRAYCRNNFYAPRGAFIRYVKCMWGLQHKQIYQKDTQRGKWYYFGIKLS